MVLLVGGAAGWWRVGRLANKVVDQTVRPFGFVVGGDVAGVADHGDGEVGGRLDVSGQPAVDVPGAARRPAVVGAAGELDRLEQVEGERVGAGDVELAAVEERPIAVEDGAQGGPHVRHQVRNHFVVDDAEAGVLGVAGVNRPPHLRPLQPPHVRWRAALATLLVPRVALLQRVVQTLESGLADERAQYAAPALQHTSQSASVS